MKKTFDVIIVGGGLAGLSLSTLLAAQGAQVMCLDREPVQKQLAATFDGRTTAVSWASQKILAAAGVWEAMAPQACPIDTIQILDGNSPVLLTFDKEEVQGRTFGWIMENQFMRAQLLEKAIALKGVTHLAPAQVVDFSHDKKCAHVHLADGQKLGARLIVGADGRQSFTREKMGIGARQWSYNQRAMTFIVNHEKPHNHVAVEHFKSSGPFAILPMSDAPDGSHRSSVVWTEHGSDKKSARHFDEDTFNTALAARFPAQYGEVQLAGKRFAYPLGLIHAHNYIAPRMALVADAAHGIHPIAGQGLNLGFRDVAVLAELVTTALQNGEDPGADDVLQTYQQRRRVDNMAMAGTTDFLTRLFSNNIMPVSIARKAGLRAVARLPFAKRFFMRQAMGASGLLLPPLIRDNADTRTNGDTGSKVA